MTIFFLIVIQTSFMNAQKTNSLITPYEVHKSNYTATYEECRDWYKKVDSAFETVKVLDYPQTDAGHPLQLAVFSADKDFSPVSLHAKNKKIILIMNAIHPGEPEGVDASMLLLRDLATKKEWNPVLKDIVILIIPQYNIEGVLNRGGFSRANQEGPESYGFRGNGENLDLNRDFIKCDSKNTRTFQQIFHEWQPDVFIDNHTSDGADYQYTLTCIQSNPACMSTALGNFISNEMTPAINKRCSLEGFEMCPYVEPIKESPDSGLSGFDCLPRYSMGYTALWNTISYTVETHMLKPFDQRLKATYSFMTACINEVHINADKITALREKALAEYSHGGTYNLQWEQDTSRFDMIDFKGYEAAFKPSNITGAMRLYYDRNKPYNKKIKYYNYFKPSVTVSVPSYYILPAAYSKVVELLKLNHIKLTALIKDTTLPSDIYIIDCYENPAGIKPTNGHYYHSNIKVHTRHEEVTWHKGDYLIKTDQPGFNYLMQTLEPQGEDSYFAWNFFDGILQQREYYAAYVFEDMAWKYLQEHPELKTEFDSKKNSDKAFASNPRTQLDWVYHHSPWFEKTYMRYPVGRIME
jgi:hypothetical protein